VWGIEKDASWRSSCTSFLAYLGSFQVNTAISSPRTTEHVLLYVPFVKHLLVPLQYSHLLDTCHPTSTHSLYLHPTISRSYLLHKSYS
jgi:hypothetical protein